MSKILHRQLEFGGECKARNIRLGDIASRDSRTNDPGERGQQCNPEYKIARVKSLTRLEGG